MRLRAKIKEMIDSGALERALQRVRVPPPGEAEREDRKYQSQHSYTPYPPRPYPSVYRPPPPHLRHPAYGPRPPVSSSRNPHSVHPPVPHLARPSVPQARAPPSYERSQMPPPPASSPAPSSYRYEYEQRYARDYGGSNSGGYPNNRGVERSQSQRARPERKLS